MRYRQSHPPRSVGMIRSMGLPCRSALVLCVLVVALTACGSDSSTADSTADSAATTSLPSTPVTPTSTTTTTPPTTTPPTTLTTSAPRSVVAKGTFADDMTKFKVEPVAPDGTTPFSGAVVYAGDLVGTLEGVGDGSFQVHEEGALGPDGSTASTGTLVGVSGAFLGATGSMTVTGAGGPTVDYQFDFEWVGCFDAGVRSARQHLCEETVSASLIP